MKGKILLLLGMSLAMSVAGQKSKVLAVKQMIDAGKFDEAKEAIDEAVEHPKSSDWPRTYYIKGLLCQTAYEQGMEKKDAKKTSLYPDQLYVAYQAYEKAMELNAGEKIRSQIRQKYFLLSNDFRKLGESRYMQQDFEGALKAFEHAISIGKSELISAKTDTSLVYNAGMAAFESQNWVKSITYLTELHEASYAPSTSLLLSRAHLNSGDSIGGKEIMMSSLEQYDYGDTLVMYVTNHLVGAGDTQTAISILDRSIEARPDNYRFLWARALVYETLNRYEEAIHSFLLAAELADDKPELYYHLGICYYNIGIEMRESALEITDSDSYQEAREAYLDKFREAVHWFERSYELDPQNEKTVTRLQQLYYQLQMKDKQLSLEG
jgi:tetratricopeptide (TPR) repeat protein